VFSDAAGKPVSVDYLDRAHLKLRTELKLATDFVLHLLRHTMLSRLGESGVDAFTIMRIAGHSTIVVSQRYVHPSPEAVEVAFERLEASNARAILKAKDSRQQQLPATVFATPQPAMATALR
jgi:integrase